MLPASRDRLPSKASVPPCCFMLILVVWQAKPIRLIVCFSVHYMSYLVCQKVGLVLEALATLRTRIRFLPRVGLKVGHQDPPLAKTLATLRTGIGFLTRVNSLMPYQLGLAREGPPTLCTQVRPGTRVDLQVLSEDGLMSKILSALFAWERLFTRVSPAVLIQL